MNTQKLNFKSLLTFIALFGFVVFVTSCEEKNDIDVTSSNVEVNDELYASNVFDEVLDITDEASDLIDDNLSTLKSAELDEPNGNRFGPGRNDHGQHVSCRGNVMNNRLGESVTVTRDSIENGFMTTIDFGEVNCLCNDGRERRGKIIMTHDGFYMDSLVHISVSFEDFYVDDNQVAGEKSITHTVNSDGSRESTIIVLGSLILANGEGTITHEAEKTRTVVVGSDTRTKRDDVTETAGESKCVMADGTEVSMTILAPLVRKNEVGCFRYIVQGIREIETSGESTRTIDYGDGTCDNIAEETVDGVTTEIVLERKRHGQN
ncbi:MAG: hypothetical protein PF517_20345 [Salinivirgaceae bacterium]|jgi:hypothetical protein|nr:hypothetical protein [Salinivirgaceae bacterium]